MIACSGELLLSYGFCPAPSSNPWECYALRVALAEDDPLRQLKAQALAAAGLPPAMEFPLRIDGWPEQLLPYLALVAARPQVASETRELAALLFEEGTFPILDEQDTRALALRALEQACAAASRAYAGSMEADQALAAGAEALLARGTVGTDEAARSKVREALCAAIRLRERQILARTQFIAAQQRGLVTDGAAARAAKSGSRRRAAGK